MESVTLVSMKVLDRDIIHPEAKTENGEPSLKQTNTGSSVNLEEGGNKEPICATTEPTTLDHDTVNPESKTENNEPSLGQENINADFGLAIDLEEGGNKEPICASTETTTLDCVIVKQEAKLETVEPFSLKQSTVTFDIVIDENQANDLEEDGNKEGTGASTATTTKDPLDVSNPDIKSEINGVNKHRCLPCFKGSCYDSDHRSKLLTKTFKTFLKFGIPLVYMCYVAVAIGLHPERSDVIAFDIGILLIWLYVYFRPVRERIEKLKNTTKDSVNKVTATLPNLRRIITVVLSLLILGFLIYDWYHDPQKLVPFGGLALLLFIVFITSRSPGKVHWTPVIWGVLLQFILGLLILRWPIGYAVVDFLGGQVSAFLAYTDAGSRFVFGQKGLEDHPVVFQILPVVIFFSAIINMLYYLGAMQVIIRAIARLLRLAMETSPMESFATSAHIFVGQVESSIALKPFLNDVSRSELNGIMTGGFATVAGTVLGAYIGFGVPANHLLAASFMSAPAALAVAKLSWPEKIKVEDIDISSINVNAGQESNLMEALSSGATSTIKLIAYVVVNLIAFMAILAFLDAIIGFYGERVGQQDISFEWICSYVFMPLAVVMGIPWKDCRTVGKLIGKKIVLTEFLAYIDLGSLIKKGEIEDRSAVITTYILCGFGSITSMGITLGALTAAEPRRRKDFAKGMFRAYVCGNIACFMTACVAGLLYIEELPIAINNSTMNDTSNMTYYMTNITTMVNYNLTNLTTMVNYHVTNLTTMADYHVPNSTTISSLLTDITTIVTPLMTDNMTNTTAG